MNGDLFSNSLKPDWIELPDAKLLLIPDFLPSTKADQCFSDLLEHVPWKQEAISLFGKSVLQPRVQAWYGDKSYTYSGLSMQPLPWLPILLRLKQQCESASGHKYNSLLANLYRDGKDSMGWHQDNEPELGRNPTIASLSLGGTRRFSLKHKFNDHKYQIDLQHGTLLVMSGSTQHFWMHQVAKTTKAVSPRINLTFRRII
ncbi:alpha-ketoglutarate-dependent dioxygenase AlkB family protein [Vibrio sonorensis]|uniref:alpha-ketoglutarate-dependent dioxygenase AlkB family protein n=1 Tax=Vibrio sonorensis TaxID=1004316 RepID=UPI0008D9B4A9|nr:alpha-ketoglutarate-dependent dioxygenase AlkB [Vibrio sonorensis]